MEINTLTVKCKTLHELIEALEKAVTVGYAKCRVSKKNGTWSIKITCFY